MANLIADVLSRRSMPAANGCIEWTGFKNADGYGRLGFKGKQTSAHRLAYIGNIGEIEKGLCVCHKCDNRACINPDHLFLATHAENMHDMAIKGRRKNKTHGEKNGRHKLTESQIVAIKHSALQTMFLSAEFGVSKTVIRHIKTGKLWSHVGVAHA